MPPPAGGLGCGQFARVPDGVGRRPGRHAATPADPRPPALSLSFCDRRIEPRSSSVVLGPPTSSTGSGRRIRARATYRTDLQKLLTDRWYQRSDDRGFWEAGEGTRLPHRGARLRLLCAHCPLCRPAPSAGAVSRKVETEQTQRVMLNLHDWSGDLAALPEKFHDWPITGLKELAA